MELKNKGFVIVMFLILFGSMGYAYWHFVIDRNFVLVNRIDCDPTMETCYVWECDPEAIDEEEQCTGDPEEDVWYYRYVERLAKNVPMCSNDDDACNAFLCNKDEEECLEVICDEETAEDEGVTCSYPDVFNMERADELDEEEDIDKDGAEENVNENADEDTVDESVDDEDGGDIVSEETSALPVNEETLVSEPGEDNNSETVNASLEEGDDASQADEADKQ